MARRENWTTSALHVPRIVVHPAVPQVDSPVSGLPRLPIESSKAVLLGSVATIMHGQPPVIIEPYDPVWSGRFETERRLLLPVLAPWLAGPIEHIGSTAVPGLGAKPIIDIMAAVRDLASSKPAIEALKPLQYCYFDYKADVMHWFCKPSDFERTHHLHLVPFASQLWRDRLAFRDRLRSDATLRATYENLKVALASRYREDREAYTVAKTEFVQSVLGKTSR